MVQNGQNDVEGIVPPPAGEVGEGLAVLVAVILEADLARQHRNVRQEPADPGVRGVRGVVPDGESE